MPTFPPHNCFAPRRTVDLETRFSWTVACDPNPSEVQIKSIVIGLLLAIGAAPALAAEDKVSDADMQKIRAVLTDLGCTDAEEYEMEDESIYEIDDAKCKMGTMDIKLDENFKVILISRH